MLHIRGGTEMSMGGKNWCYRACSWNSSSVSRCSMDLEDGTFRMSLEDRRRLYAALRIRMLEKSPRSCNESTRRAVTAFDNGHRPTSDVSCIRTIVQRQDCMSMLLWANWELSSCFTLFADITVRDDMRATLGRCSYRYPATLGNFWIMRPISTMSLIISWRIDHPVVDTWRGAVWSLQLHETM